MCCKGRLKFYWYPVLIVSGSTLNYFLDDKINKAQILFPGVGCFLIAVCLGSGVHASNAADNQEKLGNFEKPIGPRTGYSIFYTRKTSWQN